MSCRSRLSRAAIILSMACLVGCASHQRNEFYFAAADLGGVASNGAAGGADIPLKFYRVTVDANSFDTKTQLSTGMYKASALHDLFGDVNGEGSDHDAQGVGAYQLLFDGTDGQWKLTNTTRFTVIYGNNADAVAQQIQLFADSDQTGDDMGRLIGAAAGGRQLATAAKAEAATQKLSDAARVAATDLSNLADQLDPPASDSKAQSLTDPSREETSPIYLMLLADTTTTGPATQPAQATQPAPTTAPAPTPAKIHKALLDAAKDVAKALGEKPDDLKAMKDVNDLLARLQKSTSK